MAEEPIEKYYQNEARKITDVVFASKIFREDIKREEIQALEDLLAYYLQSNARSVKTGIEFTHKMKKSGLIT